MPTLSLSDTSTCHIEGKRKMEKDWCTLIYPLCQLRNNTEPLLGWVWPFTCPHSITKTTLCTQCISTEWQFFFLFVWKTRSQLEHWISLYLHICCSLSRKSLLLFPDQKTGNTWRYICGTLVSTVVILTCLQTSVWSVFVSYSVLTYPSGDSLTSMICHETKHFVWSCTVV